MITFEDYIGKWKNSKDLTPERISNIKDKLLPRIEVFFAYLILQGVNFPSNSATHCQISGQTYGGFRPQDCPQGSPNSSHKEGLAVDVYDPKNEIDDYIMQHQEILEEFAIYIEHPSKTEHWSHWSVKPPKSGKHVFYP